MKIINYRTINQAVEEIRRADPDTALTAWRLRRFIEEGVVKSIDAGKKHLVKMDSLINFLEHPENYSLPTKSNNNKIRKLKE